MGTTRIALLVALSIIGVGTAVPAATAGSPPDRASTQHDFAEVRRATARFHDVTVAEAAGYIDPGPEGCVEVPGLGGMGFHFVNPRLIFDGGVLDPAQPEVLLYAPTSDGRLRLVGVEYLVRVADWDGASAPDLFGSPFDGPMPEHEPGTTGDHYDQHAWIWSRNPDGTLATWNTAIRC